MKDHKGFVSFNCLNMIKLLPIYVYIYIQTAYMNYTNSHKDPWEDWYIFTQHMVNFPIGFVGFHPVTQVTLYHLDLSYNNLGSTSCQAVLVFFLVLWKEAGVFWVFHYDSNKNSHFIFMDRCLCVCWYTERLYIYMHIFTSMYSKGPIPPKSNMAKS